MNASDTILQIQVEVKNLMTDLESRIEGLYNRYTTDGEVTKLPPFESLKDERVRYEYTRVLTNCIDELNDLKLRISLLQRNFLTYRNFQPASKTDYLMVNALKERLKFYCDSLERYRFDVQDLIRNATFKIKALDAANYYNI